MSIILPTYRVLVSTPKEDIVDNYGYVSEKFGRVFVLHNLELESEIRRVMGNRWLLSRSFISFSEVLSCFFTICYDLLWDKTLVQLIASKFVAPPMLDMHHLGSALDSYIFYMGTLPYGGFLSVQNLLEDGHYGHLLFEIRMGLICDTIDEALKSVESLFGFISPQVLVRAREVLIGLHALINFCFVSSGTPLPAVPIQSLVPHDALPSPLEESSSN
ncbi:hypothetical protein SUGI_0464780 [Cryptomeria japonica]|nr:hypothetical protein SUGI_0464780 [Cryptomeria japonica]